MLSIRKLALGHCRARARLVGAAAAFLSALAVTTASADPIVVTSGTTFGSSDILAQTLVANLIGANPGITIVGTPTYTGAPGAAGLFTGGTGILPFDAGIALTTGNVSLIPGPNSSEGSGETNGVAGDPRLTAIAGVDTFDASVLSFSFIPVGDTISFQYMFGSDEYKEFVGFSYNDTFAFLLNDVNIALVPGTSTPVSINNINEAQNPDYFTDNTGGALNIEYDGVAGASFLFSLIASGAVAPGQINTIALAIADAGDDIIDSGVMLAAGSFRTPVPPPNPPPTQSVPEPSAWALVGGGILALAVRRRFTPAPVPSRG